MQTTSTPGHPSASQSHLHATFLDLLLPRIELHGRVYFRHLSCPDRRADLVAEMVALAWKWYVRLVERGKSPEHFVSAIATFAAKAVHSGRRLCGQERPNDVLSPLAQKLRGFAVERLPEYATLSSSPLFEALADNTQTEVPDQVSFRIDFPAWLATRTDRDRRIIDDLALCERTFDVARKFGLSPGRVSQLRREFKRDWERFSGFEGLPDTAPDFWSI